MPHKNREERLAYRREYQRRRYREDPRFKAQHVALVKRSDEVSRRTRMRASAVTGVALRRAEPAMTIGSSASDASRSASSPAGARTARTNGATGPARRGGAGGGVGTGRARGS